MGYVEVISQNWYICRFSSITAFLWNEWNSFVNRQRRMKRYNHFVVKTKRNIHINIILSYNDALSVLTSCGIFVLHYQFWRPVVFLFFIISSDDLWYFCSSLSVLTSCGIFVLHYQFWRPVVFLFFIISTDILW